MNTEQNNKLTNYYKDIASLLICSAGQKKKFMSDFKISVNDFLEENPDCVFDDIEIAFGTPEEISSAFLTDDSSVNLKKRLNIKKIIILALIAALVIWLIFAAVSLIDVHEEAHGTLTENILLINNNGAFI